MHIQLEMRVVDGVSEEVAFSVVDNGDSQIQVHAADADTLKAAVNKAQEYLQFIKDNIDNAD